MHRDRKLDSTIRDVKLLLHQELDPLEHGVIGALQLGNLVLEGTLAHRVTGQQRQSIVVFGLNNHPSVTPMVPLVWAEGGNVRSRSLAPVLEVVGPQVA
jgi:hypothetical protein